MTRIVLSGSGVYTPPFSISNEELVESFNTYVRRFNQKNAARIEAGEVEPLQESSAEFILKASGIKSRYVLEREGILDPVSPARRGSSTGRRRAPPGRCPGRLWQRREKTLQTSMRLLFPAPAMRDRIQQ